MKRKLVVVPGETQEEREVRRNSNVSSSLDVQKKRITSKTRSIYGSKVKVITEYMFYNHLKDFLIDISINPKTYDENGLEIFNEINYQINLDIITWDQLKEVLGHFSSGAVGLLRLHITGLDDPTYLHYCSNNHCYAYETVSGYVSALKALYTDANMQMPSAMSKEVDSFLSGYEKTISELKHQVFILLYYKFNCI